MIESVYLECLTIKWRRGCQGFFAHAVDLGRMLEDEDLCRERDGARGKAATAPTLTPIPFRANDREN